jgi:hypothetical protein
VKVHLTQAKQHYSAGTVHGDNDRRFAAMDSGCRTRGLLLPAARTSGR